MGRKLKYSKEVKVKVCEYYEKKMWGFSSISLGIETTGIVVRELYLKYKEYGVGVFEVSSRNKLYTKEFKLSVVEKYAFNKDFYSRFSY